MSVVITGGDRTLTYTPTKITLDDGTELVHTSLGGGLESVWAGDLGDLYVEVTHLGDGPHGGELVLVVPDRDLVAVGDLYTPAPVGVTPAWPVTIDLVLGLMTATTTVETSHGVIDRERLEAFHQELLGHLHGGGPHG